MKLPFELDNLPEHVLEVSHNQSAVKVRHWVSENKYVWVGGYVEARMEIRYTHMSPLAIPEYDGWVTVESRQICEVGGETFIEVEYRGLYTI